jgi:hypothetical protein
MTHSDNRQRFIFYFLVELYQKGYSPRGGISGNVVIKNLTISVQYKVGHKLSDDVTVIFLLDYFLRASEI